MEKSELKKGMPFECEKTTPWYKEEEITDEEKKFHNQIRSFNPTVEQQFKLAAAKVLGDVENLLNSAVFDYLERIKENHKKMLEAIKKLPTSAEIIEENKRTEQGDSVKEYVTVYFGVQPEDEKVMRQDLFEKYYNQYEK